MARAPGGADVAGSPDTCLFGPSAHSVVIGEHFSRPQFSGGGMGRVAHERSRVRAVLSGRRLERDAEGTGCWGVFVGRGSVLMVLGTLCVMGWEESWALQWSNRSIVVLYGFWSTRMFSSTDFTCTSVI